MLLRRAITVIALALGLINEDDYTEPVEIPGCYALDEDHQVPGWCEEGDYDGKLNAWVIR